jgi:hypothetical protein
VALNTTRAIRIAWVRVAVGVVMIAAPRLVLRMAAGEVSGSMILLTRTIGIRDVALGAGALAALNSGGDADTRAEAQRWVVAGLVSDALDTLAGATSARLVGRRSAILATTIATPMVAADLRALSGAPESDPST